MQQLQYKTELYAGYPYNLTCDYTSLSKFFNYLLNNAGYLFVEPDFGLHSRKFEQELLAFFIDLYKIAHQDFWGYVTSDGTEGNLYGVFLGREVYPQGILYSSQEDSHYCIAKAAKLFRMTHLVTDSQHNKELGRKHLEQLICTNRNCPAIINLNTGITVKGAIDNLAIVLKILNRNNIKNYYVYCDGAIADMMLPFLQTASQINFNKTIDSVAISAKFIGFPLPCGVVLTKKVCRYGNTD